MVCSYNCVTATRQKNGKNITHKAPLIIVPSQSVGCSYAASLSMAAYC